MTRLDDGLWQLSPAGGIGPTAWLGSALIEPARTFYCPLHDYHTNPPDLPPDVAARCRVVQGKPAILAQTTVPDRTSVLASSMARIVAESDWLAVVGDAAGPAGEEQIVNLFLPSYEDRALAVFQFWWASAAGREDLELQNAVWFTACHQLATRGYVGLITATDDQAVIDRYTVDIPVFRSPWDVLVELGREGMVGS